MQFRAKTAENQRAFPTAGFPPAPPPVAGISIDAAAGAALRALAASGNATHPAFAALEVAPAPGFAHKWLELSEARPWPEDDLNAGKNLRALLDKNAESAQRRAWAEASHAASRTCSAGEACKAAP